MKRLILVTSPPASGKTYVSRELAKRLSHVVYLDKDTLIVLSKQIFVAAKEEYNRSSPFFQQYVRDYEYYAIVDLALEALEYEQIVLINAPFSEEVRDQAYIDQLEARLRLKGAVLTVLWVQTDVDIVHQRMLERNSDRDTWKLTHWDEYVAGIDYSIPTVLRDPTREDRLLIFHNNSQEEFEASMQQALEIIEERR